MNADQIMGRLNRGEALMAAEWRGARVEEVKWTNTKTHQREERVVIRHALEADGAQLSLVEWVPAGAKVETVKVPFKRGQRVLVVLDKLITDRGVRTVGGRLEVDG